MPTLPKPSRIKVEIEPGHRRKIPTGLELKRDALLPTFKKQLRRAFQELAKATVGIKKDVPPEASLPPDAFYDLEGEWNRVLGERAAPFLELYHDAGAQQAAFRLGVSPQQFAVKPPFVREAIKSAAFQLSAQANGVTQAELNAIVPRLKREILDGVFVGEPVAEIRNRVEDVFGELERFRADRIARTESARAVNGGQLRAMEESELVVGKQWLLSADPCPICLAIWDQDRARAQSLKLRDPFATTGDGSGFYDVVQAPPAHPNCMCSLTDVLA